VLCKFAVGVLAVLTVLAVGFDRAEADRHIVELGSNDVKAVTPLNSELGKFYTVVLEIPAVLNNKELLKAFLEITVDVSARNTGDYVDDTPVLEVYRLTEDFDGVLDTNKIERSSPMRRNIRTGTDRKIRIDVTEAVKAFIANPSLNHGLILGSFTGSRDGLFDIKSSGGTVAKIKYFYVNG
jgi:hypothetical protein